MSENSVLIVDDDALFGQVVEQAVSRMGHNAERITNPREITSRYDKVSPGIIFLDIFMPDFDGVEVGNWLADKHFDGTLVLMTGHDPAFLATARQLVARRSEAKIATLEKPARVNKIYELLSEQRLSSRKRSLKAGTIVYHHENCTMRCMVLDLSDGGARLKPTDIAVLPATFRLKIDYGPIHNCQFVRRIRDEIAVRFL